MLRYYSSIENLPIEIWFKINESQDYSLLVRNKLVPCFVTKEQMWTKIYDEFIERIGLNDDFKEYLEAYRRIAIMQCNWVISPSPADKVRIASEIRELEDRTKGKKLKYNEIIAIISKQQGYRIDAKKVSVWEFYGYINNGR